MRYFSCNGESAIAACDPYNWDINLKKKIKSQDIDRPIKHSKPIRRFQYSELVAATNGFSADNFLGKGSHGSVYRAALEKGNLIAAVKRTKFTKPYSSNSASCNATTPADNEIEILSRVRHPRRFVNLVGFSADTNDNKLIVVEYMPNGSLYDLLHSVPRPPGWTRRVRFALQVAKAVRALHSSNPPVIHRDIKSSNVLLDGNWDARLGDFGLAIRGHVEDVHVKCTPPAGTLGYLDPGYLAPGDLSTKSDVFSFGILLLEIISGRNAIDVKYSPPSVVDWAVPLIKRGDFAEICDPRVGSPSDPYVVRKLTVLAARCVRVKAQKRPSMEEVVECLKSIKKMTHAPPIWNSLRRRVRRVEKDTAPLMQCETYERSEEVMKAVKVVGSRRNKKISSVSGLVYESEPVHFAVRSKSIGSDMEMSAASDLKSSGNKSQCGVVFRKQSQGVVAVKMPMVKLSKSRSMGVLQSPRLHHHHHNTNPYKNSKTVFRLENSSVNPIQSQDDQVDAFLSKLAVLDHKKDSEKPWVNSIE